MATTRKVCAFGFTSHILKWPSAAGKRFFPFLSGISWKAEHDREPNERSTQPSADQPKLAHRDGRRRFLTGAGIILTSPSLFPIRGAALGDSARPAHTSHVRFRFVDAVPGETTPAMACVVDANSDAVRLPPDGRILKRPSTVEQLVSGVKFDPAPNWIGPVRQMQRRVDNNDRSHVYEDRPSIPYWPNR